jgi:hypothetical protein
MGVEKQEVPDLHDEAKIQREGQIVSRRRVVDRRRGLQENENCIIVIAAGPPEPGIGKRRVLILSMRADSVVHGMIELIVRPGADPRLSVGSDVRGVDHAERRFQPQTPGERLAAITLVAGHAISGCHEILPATQLGGVGRRVGDRLGKQLGCSA